jgi:hypothetical protein
VNCLSFPGSLPRECHPPRPALPGDGAAALNRRGRGCRRRPRRRRQRAGFSRTH